MNNEGNESRIKSRVFSMLESQKISAFALSGLSPLSQVSY